MRRIIMLLTVVAFVVAMIAVSAVPAVAAAGDDCVVEGREVTCGPAPYIWIIEEGEWEEEPIVADPPEVRKDFDEVFGSGDDKGKKKG
jgi:hypothetical protein